MLPGFIEYQQIANYPKTMEVNIFAVVTLTQQLIPYLKSSRGRIVIVSSVDGIVSLPGNAPYDATKFAVEAYDDALRVELKFGKVHFAVINPSTLRTPLALNLFGLHKLVWESMDRLDPDGGWKEAWNREWLDEYVSENAKRLEQMAQDPKHAINDIHHALAAKHPKMRYLSGTLAKTLFFTLSVVPEHGSSKKSTINPPPRTIS